MNAIEHDILECPVCLRPFEKHSGGMYLQWPHLCSARCTQIYARIAARSDGMLTVAARAILERGQYPGNVILPIDTDG